VGTRIDGGWQLNHHPHCYRCYASACFYLFVVPFLNSIVKERVHLQLESAAVNNYLVL